MPKHRGFGLLRGIVAGSLVAVMLAGCAGSNGPETGPLFPELTGADPAAPSMTDAEIAAAGREPGSTRTASTRPRLFGFLQKRVPGDVTESGAPSAPVVIDSPPPVPSMTDEEIAAAGRVAESPPSAPRRRGLFGFLGKREPDRNAAADAPPLILEAGLSGSSVSGLLPFGQVLRVCGAKRGDMGKVVARTPSAGGFKLHDTDPTSLEPRTQYLTGFRDGCARQFTASLALFGTASVHEATRYNPLNTNPYTATDTAYEKIKNRICGVRKGQFCPEKRTPKLEKATAFVSVYRSFGDTGEWMEIFLHKGQLVTYESRVQGG